MLNFPKNSVILQKFNVVWTEWMKLCNEFWFLFCRNFVTEVHSKADSIIKNQIHQPTAQVQPLGYDQVSIMQEIRDSLNLIKRDSSSKTGHSQSCPTCATSTIVLVAATVQTLLFIAYVIYK